MKIIIGSDKSGYNLKEVIKTDLLAKGYQVDDKGTLDIVNFMPYYEVAPIIAQAVSKGEYEKGILICGTGAGMNIVANKFKGVYSVCVESLYTAKMASVVNKANVLSLGGWVIAPEMGIAMVDAWLNTDFTNGFDEIRTKFLTNAYKEVQNIDKVNKI